MAPLYSLFKKTLKSPYIKRVYIAACYSSRRSWALQCCDNMCSSILLQISIGSIDVGRVGRPSDYKTNTTVSVYVKASCYAPYITNVCIWRMESSFLCISLCRRKYNTGSSGSASLSYTCHLCIDPCVVPTCIVVLDLGYVALVSVILVVETFLHKKIPSNSFSLSLLHVFNSSILLCMAPYSCVLFRICIA